MGRPAAERADQDPRRSRGPGSLTLPPRLIARLERALRPGRALVAILDYDGTLTPTVGTPGAARLAPATRVTLARLAAHPRVGLAILSGRALADVRRRVGLGRVVYGGCHGLEIAGAGLSFRHPAARRARVGATRRRLAAAVRGIPGTQLEWKGLAVSLHYRHVPAPRVQAVRRAAAEVARGAPDLSVIAGHKVFDFVPRVGWDKGRAAQWIARRLRAALPGPATVLYVGDDTTDEAAFKALRHRAVTVRVGATPTAARHVVRGVREVHALLRFIVRALGRDDVTLSRRRHRVVGRRPPHGRPRPN